MKQGYVPALFVIVIIEDMLAKTANDFLVKGSMRNVKLDKL